MKKLLSFKHWQLFLLIVVCGAWTSPSPLKEIINSLAIITFALWIYAVGVYGQDRIATIGLNARNLNLFKINVMIIVVLSSISLFYSALGQVTTASETFGSEDTIFIVVGLYLLFAVLQVVIFASKTIAKLEYRREITFGDYLTNVLLMLFFFIGVWILQPKINKFIEKETEVL